MLYFDLCEFILLMESNNPSIFHSCLFCVSFNKCLVEEQKKNHLYVFLFKVLKVCFLTWTSISYLEAMFPISCETGDPTCVRGGGQRDISRERKRDFGGTPANILHTLCKLFPWGRGVRA